VQVTVRVTGPRCVVPHDRGLDLLNRHLDLAAMRTDSRRGVLGDPANDLGGGAFLGGVVSLRDLSVQRRGKRPGLGPVDDHLDEPQRMLVLADPTLRDSDLNLMTSDPPFVGVPVHPASTDNTAASRGSFRMRVSDVPLGNAGALSQVIVVSTRPIGLDVVAGGSRVAAIELHPTTHDSSPPVSRRQSALK
jgi:hypothetical protein